MASNLKRAGLVCQQLRPDEKTKVHLDTEWTITILDNAPPRLNVSIYLDGGTGDDWAERASDTLAVVLDTDIGNMAALRGMHAEAAGTDLWLRLCSGQRYQKTSWHLKPSLLTRLITGAAPGSVTVDAEAPEYTNAQRTKARVAQTIMGTGYVALFSDGSMIPPDIMGRFDGRTPVRGYAVANKDLLARLRDGLVKRYCSCFTLRDYLTIAGLQ